MIRPAHPSDQWMSVGLGSLRPFIEENKYQLAVGPQVNRAIESNGPDEKICNEKIKAEHKTDYC